MNAFEPFFINPHKGRKRRKARRRSRRNLSLGVLNPRRRKVKRRKAGRRPATRRRVRRRRARRNPARLSLRGIQGQLGDAAALAAGLIGVTFALNLIPIPAQLRTGWTRHITKGAVGLGLGWAVSQVNREWGKWVSLGALSAVVVDVVNDFSAQSGMLALPSPRTGVAGLGGFPGGG